MLWDDQQYRYHTLIVPKPENPSHILNKHGFPSSIGYRASLSGSTSNLRGGCRSHSESEEVKAMRKVRATNTENPELR